MPCLVLKHKIRNMLSTIWQAKDYPGDLYELTNAGSTSAETNRQSYRMTSFLGRANYNYADRYYLGLSYRTDGSSRLARENRWGSFWSVSGAWRFIDESFLNPVKSVLTDGSSVCHMV